MITKFIYEIDQKNRKKLVALVEDKNPNIEYDGFFPLEERANFIRQENEEVTYTNGSYYYIAFNTDEAMKYLDIDIQKEGVKIRVTDNLVYAACYSLEFMHQILKCFSNFGFESIIEIPSYITLNRKNELTDTFEKIFAKIKDDSYCQINEDDEIKFVAKDTDYYLTKIFSKAVKLNKRDIRQILVINGFIDRQTQKTDVYFSPYNCFYDGETRYANAGSVEVSFVDEVLEIKENTNIDGNFHLVNNEEKFKMLVNIKKALNAEVKSDSYYLSYDGRYVYEENDKYFLVTNPSKATLFAENKMEAIKMAYTLFIRDAIFQRFNTNLVYMYEQENVYSFHKEEQEGVGKIIYSQYYDAVKRLIFDDFTKGNSIIIVDDKYMKLEVINHNSFKIEWLDTAYKATQLSLEAANVLIEIFRWKAKRKDLISNLDFKRINIGEGQNTTYQEILDTIVKNKDRMCAYDNLFSIKTETEKGSLEYLRRFYQKTISDMEELFEKLLDNKKIKNILVIGAGCNLELIALNNIMDKIGRKINYATLETNKWGYFPHINLNSKINYKMAYRCDFCDLTSDIINQYDLIVFTKTFNEENISLMLEEIKNNKKNIILANVMTSNLYKVNDEFYNYFSTLIKVNRKLFDREIADDKTSEKVFNYMKKNVCRCQKEICSVIKPITDRKNSYYSVIEINGEVKNYFHN